MISAYAPIEDKKEEIKADEIALERLLKQDMQFLYTDFDARAGKESNLGPTIGQHSLHDISNDN